MPSNQTTNYQLSQWVKSDQVKMEDFNADNAKIDAALASHAAALAGKGNCRIEFQSYIGTAEEGANSVKRLTFSARPAFVFIMGESDVRWLNGFSERPLFLGGYEAVSYHLTLTPGSFHWEGNTAVLDDHDPRLDMNYKGHHYFVIAFIPEDMKVTSSGT